MEVLTTFNTDSYRKHKILTKPL